MTGVWPTSCLSPFLSSDMIVLARPNAGSSPFFSS